MNKIEELNVKLEKAFHGAQKLENQIRCIQEEIKNFEKKQEKPKLRAEKGGKYYYLYFNGGCLVDCIEEDNRTNSDDCDFENNNYFLTKERAQEVADKMNFLLRIERLHDELCPDYQPRRDKGQTKYYITYNANFQKYLFDDNLYHYLDTQVYFQTKEIAQQACDILNAELEQTKE